MQMIQDKLQAVFSEIAEQRMQNVPVYNHALQVKAIGFTAWNQYYLGIMLTPWFMNLMLLPLDAGADLGVRPGEKQTHSFPSGQYEFVAGENEQLGNYLVCSLFSPMFEFTDQETAERTATTILDTLMEEQQGTHAEATPQLNRSQNIHEQGACTRVPAETAISRRDFLRGRINSHRE